MTFNRASLARKDLSLLLVFDAIAETRSVTLAAKKLSLSQPAVSHALRKMRDEFQNPLFVRVGQGLVLTPRAEEMIEPVRAFLENAERLMRPDRPDPASYVGEVKIAMSDTCLRVMGGVVAERVGSRAPRLKLIPEILTAESDQKLIDGALDVAFCKDVVVPRALRSIELKQDRLVGMVDAGHPLASSAPSGVSLEAFTSFPHVVVRLPNVTGDPVGTALSKLGAPRQLVGEVANDLEALAAINDSNCIVAVPSRLAYVAREQFPNLAMFELPLKVAPIRHRMVWHSSSDGIAVLSWLREALRDIAGEFADAADAATMPPSVMLPDRAASEQLGSAVH